MALLKESWNEISGQKVNDYLWPDMSTSLGKKTGLYEGAYSSLGLTIIYGFFTIKLSLFGVTIPAEVQEYAETGLFDVGLMTSMTILLDLIACLTAIYYIRSIGKKRSFLSVLFLVLWLLLEVLGEFFNGFSIMLIVYIFLFIGSLNAYRSIKSLTFSGSL